MEKLEHKYTLEIKYQEQYLQRHATVASPAELLQLTGDKHMMAADVTCHNMMIWHNNKIVKLTAATTTAKFTCINSNYSEINHKVII